MPTPTVSIFLNSTTPAAPTGDQNVKPQSDGAAPLDSVSFYPQKATASLRGTVKPDGQTTAVDGAGTLSANVGTAAVKTANYTAVATDNGMLLSFADSSPVTAHTLTLPSTPPFAKWKIAVQNLGAGVLTVSPNGLLIDTVAANLTLNQGQGVEIFTDGTNYFTERGAGATGAAGGDLGGTYPNPAVVATHLTAPLPVAQGGSGSASPSLLAGSNVNVTGAWPNQTVSAFGGSSGVSGPAQVQLVSQSPATSTITFASPNTLGNTIVVFFAGYVAAGLPTVTDSRGNTYVAYAQQNPSSTIFGGFAIATNCAAGSNTVSISTIGGDGLYLAIEYSGVTGIETSQPIAANGANASPLSVGPITTTAPNTLILLYGITQNGGGSMTNSGGWSAIYNGGDTHNVTAGLFSFVAGTAGTYSNSVQYSGGGSNTNKQAGMLGLKGAPSGVGTVTSVGLSMPSDFTVSGSPVTSSGVIAVTGGVTKSGIQQEAYTYAADTGTANAYAVAYSPAPTLVAGSAGSFKALNACTGASTLAVNGGTPIAIKKNGNSTALASGDIAANQIIDWTYDGTVIQILVPGSGGGVSSLNSLTGALSIAAGTGITVTPSGSTVTIANSATLSNPMTAQGDIIYGGTSGTPTRLAAGTSGNVLQTNGAGAAPTWVAPSGGGGGSFPLSIVQEATYQSGGSNVTSFTVTFPSALAASGNTAFMLIACDANSTTTIPAGWTSDFNQPQATFARLVLCHKTSASDTSATITASSAGNFAVYFFEVAGSHALDQSSLGGIANAQYIPLPAITPTANSVVFGMACVVLSTTQPSPFQLATETIAPTWKTLNVAPPASVAGRALVGHVSTVAATAVSTKPPVISLPNTNLFASGGVAYATFSIL